MLRRLISKLDHAIVEQMLGGGAGALGGAGSLFPQQACGPQGLGQQGTPDLSAMLQQLAPQLSQCFPQDLSQCFPSACAQPQQPMCGPQPQPAPAPTPAPAPAPQPSKFKK